MRERNPPPTGVVMGPLSATTYSRIAARVASGSNSPYWNIAFSPAGTGYHAIVRRPWKAVSTAASIAWSATWTTSGPIPSPSISGTIGSSGMRRPSAAMRILCPRFGGRKTRRSDGIGSPQARSSRGTYARSFGPTYQSRGRRSRLSSQYSRTWAVQPGARESAKTGVKRSVEIPRRWNTSPE